MKKIIFIGLLILNSQVMAGKVGDKIQLTSSNIRCTERVKNQGKYFLYYILSKGSKEAKQAIQEDSKGKCRMMAIEAKDKLIAKILEQKKGLVAKGEMGGALERDASFEYLKVEILSLMGAKPEKNSSYIWWIIELDSLKELPMYKVIN